MIRVTVLTLLHLLGLATGTSTNSDYFSLHDSEPNPPFPPITDGIHKNFVSATLGSNMVLQRDVEAILWGYTQPGATVTTTFHPGDGLETIVLTTTARDEDGLWRSPLPPQPAMMTPAAVAIKSDTGETQVLDNLLFGDVYLCGGQSNMAFALPGNTNGTAEADKGEQYQHIRVFTVGQKTQSITPLPDLQTILQPWSVAGKSSLYSTSTVPPGPHFAYFSSVCWFFGREIADGLDNKVPIGLISNNWGGTAVEQWIPGGNLYNAMIYPYMIGPMKVTGFTWYQGEANARGQAAADDYAIKFPKMIQAWRDGFQVPDAYFGFVQLSTWCPGSPLDVPELRQAQMAALNLSGKIGYATNADHGDGCNIHPPPKQYCGARLGKSALALQYGKQIPWKSPSYAGAKSSQLRRFPQQGPSIAIQLKDVSSKGLYLLETPYNLQTEDPFTCDGQVDGTCAGAQVLLNGKGWVKATISLDDTGTVWFTAKEGGSSDSIVATSYGWGSVPLMTIYDAGTDLPVLPWNEKV